MTDVIQLLPDAVANQIAAGEVIQRPASVVKELIENAVDAGSDQIDINIKEAGRTLVQVIDNGIGMSETDARIAFERHATSKIKEAADLFDIRTKGFRGEALASIASIAQVNVKTRQPESEVGTQIQINGSDIELQEPVSCPQGTNFAVRNLFFNVPARRKFLKSNTTEFKHILNEFQRVAMAHPELGFKLIHNDQVVYNLIPGNSRQRLVQIFGKQLNQNLNRIETDTSLIRISGFVGKPEFARKTSGEQFFFINQRYMRHPYFHRAIMKAYENLLPVDSYPSYFLFFESDPACIDINIHPTKTEIKFENEQAIFQVIMAAVKESLGKANLMPSIDFDTHGVVNIPTLKKDTEVSSPQINVNPAYNPFDSEQSRSEFQPDFRDKKNAVPDNWDLLYAGLEKGTQDTGSEQEETLFGEQKIEEVENKFQSEYLQVKGKFILTAVKSGLMVIDQKRAHERILYEQFVQQMALNKVVSQKALYPEKIDLVQDDYILLQDIIKDLEFLGFDIGDLGSGTVVLNGFPGEINLSDPKQLLEQLLEEYKQTGNAVSSSVKEKLAISLAAASSIPYGKTLAQEEISNLVDQLFGCENPNYSPTGKKIVAMVQTEELDKMFT